MSDEVIRLGIDAGSADCRVVVLREAAGGCEVLARVQKASAGIEAGSVVDMAQAAAAIRDALKEAASQAGVRPGRATVAVHGIFVRTELCHGATGVRGREVSAGDVARANRSALEGAVPAGRRLLHCIPIEYFVDHRGSVRDPTGLRARRLEVRALVVDAEEAALRDLSRCVRKAGAVPGGFRLGSFAAAAAVLSPDEREGATALLHAGETAVEIVLLWRGTPIRTALVRKGARDAVDDLRSALHLSGATARRVLVRHGCVAPAGKTADDPVDPAGAARSGRPTVRLACDTAAARFTETFGKVQDVLDETPALRPESVVLTGGAAALPGIDEVAQEVLRRRVRVAAPGGGLPEGCAFAAAAGLVQPLPFGRAVRETPDGFLGWILRFAGNAF